MCIIFCFNAYSTIKLFSFSSIFWIFGEVLGWQGILFLIVSPSITHIWLYHCFTLTFWMAGWPLSLGSSINPQYGFQVFYHITLTHLSASSLRASYLQATQNAQHCLASWACYANSNIHSKGCDGAGLQNGRVRSLVDHFPGKITIHTVKIIKTTDLKSLEIVLWAGKDMWYRNIVYKTHRK